MVRCTVNFWKQSTTAIDISTHVTPPWFLAKILLLYSDIFISSKEKQSMPSSLLIPLDQYAST